MKAFSFLILICLGPFIQAQYLFPFEEGRILRTGDHPGWMLPACSEHWGLDSLQAIEGRFSLAHVFDNPQSDREYFRIRHDPWQRRDSLIMSFRIRHAYAPSASNNWQVAFLSDFVEGLYGKMELLEGLVVGVNLQGKDDLLKIWQVLDGKVQERCSSALNYQEEIGIYSAPAFGVTLMESGEIRLYLEPFEGREGRLALAEGNLKVIPKGREMALCYSYSAGQDRKLWLDEWRMDGDFRPDSLAPRFMGWKNGNPDELLLYFSEEVKVYTSDAVVVRPAGATFFGSADWLVDTMEIRDSLMMIRLGNELPNREQMQLYLRGIGDADGNIMADTLVEIMRNDAVWGDVVISEIMCDPEPAAGSVWEEYIELHNRSQYRLTLDQWSVLVGDRRIMSDPLILEAGAYGVLEGIGLPNDGAVLALQSKEGVLIHAVAYGSPLDGPDWKKEGGWSLESPDPELLCGVEEHWSFSEDPSGGTPGLPNSRREQIRDRQAPLFLYLGIPEIGRVALHFSESTDRKVPGTSEVILQPAGEHPHYLELDFPMGKVLHGSFKADAETWEEFRIQLHGVSDCAGNYSGTLDIRGGNPLKPVPGCLLISELMFDPDEEGLEYIECYFPGPGYLDLQKFGLGLSAIDEEAGQYKILSDHSRLVAPGTYLVLTRDEGKFRNFYGYGPSARWVELPAMGTLSNTEGMVSIADRSGNIIDRLVYREGMHIDPEGFNRGISLERISFLRSAMERDNWHSCATVALNGTPGMKNSQAAMEDHLVGKLEIEPRIISPNNDAYQDVLHIRISGLETGSRIQLWITDLEGNSVRVLANKHIGGSSLAYSWDGRDGAGSLLGEGIYLVHLRTWHPDSGRGRTSRMAFGLVHP